MRLRLRNPSPALPGRSAMVSRLGIALLVCACGAHLLLAQAPQQPTFRVQVEAIEIDASVTDARGNVVTDLTKDDFEILENGRPQTITSFGAREHSARCERSVRCSRPTRSSPTSSPTIRAKGACTSSPSIRSAGEQILRTRRFVRRFIEQYFAPNDLGAVVFLGRADHSKAQGLTNNPRLLLNRSTRSAAASARGAADAGAPGDSRRRRSAEAPGPPPIESSKRNMRLREAMSSFRQIVEYMATVHGRRKALLLFSQGYPRGDLQSARLSRRHAERSPKKTCIARSRRPHATTSSSIRSIRAA